MTFKLFKCDDQSKTLNKTYSNEKDFEGVLIDDTQLSNPVIRIKTSPEGYNKIFIPAFNRYYDFTYEKVNSYFELTCSVDVWKTFNNNILNHEAIIRSSGKGSLFLNGSIPVRSRNRTQVKAFSNSFSSTLSNYVLITQGGSAEGE